jgi:formate dehydrogenase subunit beta
MESILLDMLKDAFENQKVQGAVLMSRTDDGYNYVYYSNLSDIHDITPFQPLMKVNGATVVSTLTKENSGDKIFFLLKPCETRAAVELKKLNQVNLENTIIASYICPGVLNFKEGNSFDDNDKFFNDFVSGTLWDSLRPVCLSCVNFSGEGSDILFDFFNKSIVALNAKGEEFLNDLNIDYVSEIKKNENFSKISETRKKNFENLIKEKKKFFKSEDKIVEYFDRCIGCHACSHACPICYCKQCYFESDTFKYYPDSTEKKLVSKGALRLPMDRVMFHLGRVTHMATSCVSCGMCEDVCPVDIKVSQFFKYMGANIQKTFDYVPGINREVTLPLLTFREEEFREAED